MNLSRNPVSGPAGKAIPSSCSGEHFRTTIRGPATSIDLKQLRRRKPQRELKIWNDNIEPELRINWELETGVRRLQLRPRVGRSPTWKWDKSHGKLTREGKG